MEIVSGSTELVPQVLRLWEAAGAVSTATDDESAIEVLLEHDLAALLLVRVGDSIVASLIVGFDGWRGSFHRLVVDPSRRRQGIARALVRAGEERLLARGCRRVALIAVVEEVQAGEFWRAMGYEPQESRQRYVKNLDRAPEKGIDEVS